MTNDQLLDTILFQVAVIQHDLTQAQTCTNQDDVRACLDSIERQLEIMRSLLI